MIGISEGIVLADRYRLTRRQSERETGASWIAVDLETGSDVWVQFTDHGGLAQAADLIRGLTSSASSVSAALPSVLDTGELRMIVDSRAIAALRGGAEAYSTHVEIVVEFVVVKPLAGRGLPAKIQRKALPPAEALAIAATLAGALGAALAAGGSHGWLGAGSVWLVRRGGCVLDLALGLAYPDGSVIELEQQVTGYYAPERLAVAGAAGTAGKAGMAVGSGSKATEAADVFALGWMLYEMLAGHAELVAEYERLVANAGAVTTVELLVLWRARARAHLTELVEADSALALLVLACLAENAAERPDLAAFGERARSAAKALAGAAPLVVPVARTRAVAAEAGIAGAEIAAAAVVGAGAGLLAGAALAGEASASAGAGASAGSQGTEAANVAGAAGAANVAEVADVADVAGAGDEGTAAGATSSAEVGGATSGGGLDVASGATSATGSALASDSASASASSASVAASESGEAAASAVVAEAETVVLAAAIGAGVVGAGAGEALAAEGGAAQAGAASSGSMSAASFGAEGLAGSGNSAGSGGSGSSGSSAGSGGEAAGEREKEIERLSHRARLATIGGTAAAVVALGVGVAVGYSVGHSGNNSATLTTVGANAVVPISSASSSPVAAPAPTVTVTVTVTVTEAVAGSPAASASSSSSSTASGSTNTTASSSPSTISSPPLPAPSSSGEAISELNQEIQYLRGSGQISESTSKQLTTAVSKLKSSLGTGSYSSSLSSLTSLIRSLKGSGHLSITAEATLESILGYFYAGSGS